MNTVIMVTFHLQKSNFYISFNNFITLSSKAGSERRLST